MNRALAAELDEARSRAPMNQIRFCESAPMNQINLANKYDGRSKMKDVDDDIVFGKK